jgi:mannose-6-phosphate isomerase-like protein (cupin superfamily)
MSIVAPKPYHPHIDFECNGRKPLFDNCTLSFENWKVDSQMTDRLEYGEPWTTAALGQRLVRYDDLIPCFNAFIDCRTPGSEAKENFTIIGPGVSENPAQHVHIAEPHGFNIGGARQPPACVNSQHSHDTAEVFVAHSGHWRFDLGEHGEDAHVELHPGDVISIPTHTFRGFTNIGAETGFLFAVLGQDNPGRVTWAPDVFAMATDYGLVLLENGRLVDTAAGESIPVKIAPMPVTSPTQVAALQRLVQADAQKLVCRNDKKTGTGAAQIIGSAGPLGWDHGFGLDRIDVAPGDSFDWFGDSCAQVLFVHEGEASISCSDGMLVLGTGDTLSLPPGLPRNMISKKGAVVFLVRRA